MDRESVKTQVVIPVAWPDDSYSKGHAVKPIPHFFHAASFL